MKGIERFAVCLAVLVAVLPSPAFSEAQSPFEGTWRVMLNQSQFSPKPLVAFLSEGWYHCTSCNPQIDIRANGSDQPVLGQAFETISVRETNPKSIQIITKKGGNVLTEQTRTASSDGKRLTIKTTVHPTNGGQETTTEIVATRVGIAPAGINGTSGSWRITRVSRSENAVLITYRLNGDRVTVIHPAGETFTARFDGRDYPVKNAHTYNTVALRRIDKNTIQQTGKRDDMIVAVIRVTVSADGAKMTIVDTSPLTDRTSTYIAVKQR